MTASFWLLPTKGLSNARSSLFALRSSLFTLLVVLTSSHVFAQAPPPAPEIYDLTATAPQQYFPVVEVYEWVMTVSGARETIVPNASTPPTLTPTFTTMTPPPPMPSTQTYSKHVGAVQINNPTPNRHYWVKAYYYDSSGNGVKNYVPVTQTLRP